jgi:hypothetical protein
VVLETDDELEAALADPKDLAGQVNRFLSEVRAA